MGNWHCVPSSCAEVVYQEYEPPKIRWRYGNEPWQEIIGADDYSIAQKQQYETSNNYNYTFKAKARCSTSSPPPGVAPNVPRNFVADQEIVVYTIGTYQGPIYDVKKIINANNVNLNITYLQRSDGNATVANCAERTIEQILRTDSPSSSSTVRVKSVSGSYNEPVVYGDIYDIQFIPTTTPPRACIVGVVDQCTFKVFKNGQIVHQETRSVCPEVEKISCRLSNVRQSIRIDKVPYLNRVEVIPWAYDVRFGLLADSDNYGLLLSKKPIPSNALNIYNNSVTSIIPNDFISITNTPESGFNLIQQIESAPGCPPPEFEVICDCQCQTCPDGTCPIECHGHICCYNDYGVSIKEIPIEDYCGGTT
jgi:hypothetical protein